MKYLKTFENIDELDPFGEEDWDEVDNNYVVKRNQEIINYDAKSFFTDLVKMTPNKDFIGNKWSYEKVSPLNIIVYKSVLNVYKILFTNKYMEHLGFDMEFDNKEDLIDFLSECGFGTKDIKLWNF